MGMGEIIPFVFKHGGYELTIRVVIIDGDPWFVAVDVCRVLELGNVTAALRGLDADEKGLTIVKTLGGAQELNILSEPGLYKLIQGSRKPAAKTFDRFVRHEILPAYRRGELVSATREPDLLAAINGVETRLGARLDGIDEKLDGFGDRFPPAVVRYVGEGVAKYEDCKCIYCHEVDVVTKYGKKLATCHAHHVNGNNADTRPENCTLPCIECHKRLTYQRRRDAIPEYEALGIAHTFHRKLKLKTRQIRPPYAGSFWNLSIAVQTDMGTAWPLARKKRSA